jgi:hypothetical protein
MYDRSVQFWTMLFEILVALPPPPPPPKKRGGGESSGRGRDIKKSLFWGAHQRFFRQMLLGGKVKRCSVLALKAQEDNMAVVIGLQVGA